MFIALNIFSLGAGEIGFTKQGAFSRTLQDLGLGLIIFTVAYGVEFALIAAKGGMFANMAMLVTTSTLVGFQFALMTRMTGSLYMAMGAHFVNNAIVNMLHVVSSTGADELMFLRITIAQMLLFIVVLVAYLVTKKRQQNLNHIGG